MDNKIFVHSCLLPSNLNREVIIRFLNMYHKTSYGNMTLITVRNYNIFTRLGTICTYLTYGNIMIGVVFSVIVSLNIGRSSYTTYLCVRPDFRSKGLARPLIQSTIHYGVNKLNVKHGYYLVDKVRRIGCRIYSWYRILNRDVMLDSGFNILYDNYDIVMESGIKVSRGLKTSKCIDKLSKIHWLPTDDELLQYTKILDFYTVYLDNNVIAIFILTPLDCIVEKSNKRVSLGMLTYSHILSNSDKAVKAIIHTAKEEGYQCLYGYILGNITSDIILNNKGHITDAVLYLDFFKHPFKEIDPSDINIPLF